MTKPEIDYRTMKLLVGLIAIGLSGTTVFFADGFMPTLSHAYCEGGRSRDLFVGLLFAIAAIMSAHNGANEREKIASKIAGIAAAGIALVPTSCASGERSLWHFAFAAVMFAILAWFCWSFFQRTWTKDHQLYAARRRIAYGVCGIGIAATMLIIPLLALFTAWEKTNAIFILEAVALSLFGVSWLIASHFFVYFEHPSERMKLV